MDGPGQRRPHLLGDAFAAVDWPRLAAQFGTPTYVYALPALRAAVAELRQAWAPLRHRICYAIKANGTLGILQALQRAGCGFDAVSGGELRRALKVGAAPQDILLSGVGKTDAEIAAALATGVFSVAVESPEEMHAVGRQAAQLGTVAQVTVRLNPDVDAQTHPHIATGMRHNKFGVTLQQLDELVRLAQQHPNLQLQGISAHIGSQITSLEPFVAATRHLVEVAGRLLQAGVALRHVGIGGGLGISYTEERPPSLAAYGAALVPLLEPLGLEVVLEPGRCLVGQAGLLLCRVVRQKQGAERRFVICDAGLNDLLRPALYGAQHAIIRLGPGESAGPWEAVDVVGPVCESADCFGRGTQLPPLQPNDLLAICTAGAYGAAMASTYNGRRRAAEVWVDDGAMGPLRRRDGWDDLWRHEVALDGAAFDGALPAAWQALQEAP